MNEVYFLFHQTDRDGSRPLRDRITKICEEREWRFLARGVPTFKTVKGRPIALVPSDFAAGLYMKAHRTRVAVLVLGSDPRVPLHPRNEGALRYERHIQLKRYMEYKCFYCKVTDDPANDGWTGMFSGWCEHVECEGDHDPRCLPFHVFRGDGPQLNLAEQRESFNQRYGIGAKRRDDARSTWQLNPRDYHGGESLVVAGHTLPVGFHWDVETDTPRDFNTPKYSWRVTGHFNVYPDAFFRRGKGKVQELK